MIYSISTRARWNGITFEPHELEPLGIEPGARCWGLWAEGHRFDESSRLDGERWLANEAPHLVVAQMHPNLWPTAFNLQALLERPNSTGAPNRRCDPFLGLADALRRCGVNVLTVRTAQVGYDLISFDAVCELPSLRPAAARLLQEADLAGADMEKTRTQVRNRGLTPEDEAKALREPADQCYRVRARAFQLLGQLLLPKLLELEARLTVIDRLRRLWHGVDENSQGGDRRSNMSLDAKDETRFRLAVGEPWPGCESSEATTSATSMLRASYENSWFLNRRICAAGENTYFLAYHTLSGRELARKPVNSLVARSSLQEGWADATDHDLDTLFEVYFKTLKDRQLDPFFRDLVPASPDFAKSGPAYTVKSATSERARRNTTPLEFESDALRLFFQQQALWPLKISAIPALAHARVWAYGGASDQNAPMPLRYEHSRLRPERTASDSKGDAGDFERIASFLNTHSRIDVDRDERGRFDNDSAVLASMHIRDRFMRMRFSRRKTEKAAFVTLRVEYVASPDPGARVRKGVTSQGLLRAVFGLLSKHEFLAQRISNHAFDSDMENESGLVEVIAKAAGPAGVASCTALSRSRGDVMAMQDEWQQELRELLAEPGRWKTISVRVEPGFVPPER
ncbi:MAG: hypothetical protein U0638_12670 [Phycisphaerales bacterium]